MDKTKVTKDLDAKTLTIAREFEAPKATVWRAYADKNWFERWWGPEGWETTLKEASFTVGGKYHYCMKCVDERQTDWYGKDSWGVMQFESIDEPDTFSYKDYFADADGNYDTNLPNLRMTVTLEETDGKTNLITVCYGETAEDIEKLIGMGMIEGFSSSCNKIDQLIKEQ